MAISRALIHVTGPRGSGKTEAIERLLEQAHLDLIVVRCEETSRVTRPTETMSPKDVELKRYKRAGGSEVARYRFRPKDRDWETFWEAKFMMNYSEGVILEGDLPFDLEPDLTVYVAQPIPGPKRLLRQVTMDFNQARARALASASDAFGVDLGRAAALEIESLIPAPLRNDPLFRVRVLQALKEVKPPRLPPVKRWVLDPAWAGIERAEVVILNARDEQERRCAEALVPEIKRIREDKEVFKDVVWRGRRLPITIVVVNLADRGDKGGKRVVSRITRVLKRVAAQR